MPHFLHVTFFVILNGSEVSHDSLPAIQNDILNGFSIQENRGETKIPREGGFW